MTSAIVDLFVNLIGNDAELIAATRRSGAALEKMTGKSKGVGEAISKAGKAAAIGLAVIGAYSIKTAADFQAEMMLVHTQAGYTNQQVKDLSNSVLNLASETGQAPIELAKGLYHIASAGFKSTEAIDILRAAAQNAAIGMSNMDDSAQGIIGVLAAGLPDIKNANDAAAMLNMTVGIGDMRFQQLNMAIATGTLPTFKTAGLGMKDFSASIATLTDNVTPANVAATRLRMAVSLLAGPSNVSVKALEALGLTAKQAKGAFAHVDYLTKYGISLSQLSADLHKPDGLLVAITDLRDHLKKSGLTAVEQAAVINKAFGGGRTSAGIQTLLGEYDRLKSKYVQLGTAADRTKRHQEDWNATQKTFKQQAHELGASLQVLAIKLGDKLLPPLTKFVNFLVTHKSAMQAFFIVMLIFLGALTIAWIAMGVAAIAASWEIILIIAAIALVAYGIYELVKHWKTVWNWIKRIANDVWQWLVHAWKATWNAVKGVVMWIWNNIIKPVVNFFEKYFLAPIKFYLKGLMVLFKIAWGFVSEVFKSFIRDWKVGWAIVTTAAKMAYDKFLKPIFAFINKWLIQPLIQEWKLLGKVWHIVWEAIKKAASKAWDFLKMIWGYIDKYGIQPLKKAIDWLKSSWDVVWTSIKNTLSTTWNKYLKPIFDTIKKAIDTVVNGFKSVINAPSSFGKKLAGFLGFAEGGFVPGAIGEPMLAVVHGGEYVVSNDMRKGRKPMTGLNPVYSSSPRNYSPASYGGGGDSTICVHVDGKKLFDVNVQRAQRNKKRNTSTFLT